MGQWDMGPWESHDKDNPAEKVYIKTQRKGEAK